MGEKEIGGGRSRWRRLAGAGAAGYQGRALGFRSGSGWDDGPLVGQKALGFSLGFFLFLFFSISFFLISKYIFK